MTKIQDRLSLFCKFPYTPDGVAEIKVRRIFKPKKQKMREGWKNYRIQNFINSLLFSTYQAGQIKA
jgi:hypothetical protein